MKKLLVIVLCLVFALGAFAGCGGDTTTDEPATDEPAVEDEGRADGLIVPDLSGQDIVVGISTGSTGTSWRDIMVSELESVGDEYKDAGVIKDYKMFNNIENGDANEQAQLVRDMIDDPEINIIMINPNDESAIASVISDAQDAGKLVVVFDAPAAAPNTLQVTLDHYAWSEKNVTFIAETLESGTLIDVFGLDGHPANTLREQAVDDVLANFPDIDLADRISGGWDQAQAKEVTAQILASGKEIDGVITQDGMAFGCLSAFLDVNKLPKVMFGDPGTAFFKEWNKLREEGADFKACAQPNPPGIGGTAFRFAISLADGKVFKDGALDNSVFYYVVTSFYTDENFDEAWDLLKDKADDYLLSEVISQEDCDAQFS